MIVLNLLRNRRLSLRLIFFLVAGWSGEARGQLNVTLLHQTLHLFRNDFWLTLSRTLI